MIKTYEASGKTVEEAIDTALVLAATSIENVEIEVLELGSHGVFGFGRKDARVRIIHEIEEPLAAAVESSPKAEAAKKPEREIKPTTIDASSTMISEDEAPQIKELNRRKPAAVDAADTKKPPRSRDRDRSRTRSKAPAADTNDQAAGKRSDSGNRAGYQIKDQAEAETVAAEALAFVNPIFQYLKVQPQSSIEIKEGILWITFAGQSLGTLIGRRGETLNALQYLTNLALNKERKEHVRLVLDVEGYRAGREDTLVTLAKKMADKAVRSGRRVELEPMNPHERRIVHIALQNDKRVDTVSQGEEPYRRVVIYRKRADKRKNQGQHQGQHQHQHQPHHASADVPEANMSLSQQLNQQFEAQMKQRH